MRKSRPKSLPRPKSLDDLVRFFERHDMGDYWDEMPEAQFDVAIKRRTHLVAIDETIANRLSEIAKSKKTTSATLVNTWLKERIRKAS